MYTRLHNCYFAWFIVQEVLMIDLVMRGVCECKYGASLLIKRTYFKAICDKFPKTRSLRTQISIIL